MRQFLYALIFLILLTSCAAPTPTPTLAPTSTFTPTKTPSPTSTPTDTPTSTVTPIPLYTLSGIVFFDYNGSGEQDLAYSSDGEQPVMELGIPDMPICVDFYTHKIQGDEDKFCTTSAEDGYYEIEGIEEGDHKISVESPTDDPATAFRYINISHDWVDIPAYEMNGVQVPAQHLPDTEIQIIEEHVEFHLEKDMILNIGLMQGFITLPFIQDDVKKMPFIFNYFDILGYRIINEEITYWDTQDGVSLNYDGRYNRFASIEELYLLVNLVEIPGVSDSHTGLDFLTDMGHFIVSGVPKSRVWYLSGPEDELRVHLMFNDPETPNQNYGNTYGHLNVQLVGMDQTVYRGQIIGLSGNSGDPSNIVQIPQLHFDLAKSTERGWHYIDIFRTIIDVEPSVENYWGSEFSYWIKDNDPQFPLVHLGD